jgi:TonB family protein
VAITPVSTIPIPAREGKVNPVANDTESQIPEAPAEKTKPKSVKEPEDAIPLKSKKDYKRAAEQFEKQHKFKSSDPRPNQVFTKSGQALTSPMMSVNNGGGVGSGQGNPFGTRLGWYEKLLRDKVSKNWHADEVDSRVQTAPPAIVTFTLMRDGSVRNVKLAGSSGNFTMDQTAVRAIETSAPFPQLPREYERDSANLEFWFRLQR